ncbi:Gamma-aminobutyric acid receptor subunit alpha-1 [Biomphalaria glabrata]
MTTKSEPGSDKSLDKTFQMVLLLVMSISLYIGLSRSDCLFSSKLQGAWSIPHVWDNLSIADGTVSGLRIDLNGSLVVTKLTCFMNQGDFYIVTSSNLRGPKGDYSIFMCWEFVSVTYDTFLFYQLTARDGVVNNGSWVARGRNANISEDDVCSEQTHSANYYPMFRRDIEAWINFPLCPKFVVDQVLDCRSRASTCKNADQNLYRPESSMMACQSFKLKCAFLYLANTELDGDKVICVGEDAFGNFSVGFYLGVCKLLRNDLTMPCDQSKLTH